MILSKGRDYAKEKKQKPETIHNIGNQFLEIVCKSGFSFNNIY